MPSFRITRPAKKRLDPVLFTEDEKLVPELRDKIISEVHQFAADLKIEPDKILGIYIIGSSAGFSWYPEADIDINVLVDWDRPPKLQGPTVFEAYYGEKRYEKSITYFFTKDIGSSVRSMYDVLAEEFVIPPLPQEDVISEKTMLWAKRWLAKIETNFGELKLDIHSYKDIKESYELSLLYGTKEQSLSLEKDLALAEAEIEKDIQLLNLNYKLVATFRGAFNEEFWSGVGNVIYKSLEYSGCKDAIKVVSETYKEFKKGELSFDEMIDKIEAKL